MVVAFHLTSEHTTDTQKVCKPVAVELPISKAEDLAHDIEIRIKVAGEECKPYTQSQSRSHSMPQTENIIGQRQLECALNEPENGGVLVGHSVADGGHNPLPGQGMKRNQKVNDVPAEPWQKQPRERRCTRRCDGPGSACGSHGCCTDEPYTPTRHDSTDRG
jgi:hypothetical protein